MDLILSYYKNPIFGILVLISLVLIIALAELIFSNLKENKTNKNIKKYLENLKNKEDGFLKKLNLEENINLANTFFKASMFLECKQILIFILKEIPNNKDLLYLLAQCNLKLGLLNDAKEILLTILKSRARDEKSLLCLAYVYFKFNDFENCKEVYKSLCILGNYEKDLKFIENYQTKIVNLNDKIIKINDEVVIKENIQQFFLCKNCSANSLFYTPFCHKCFRCDTMQVNLRIKL